MPEVAKVAVPRAHAGGYLHAFSMKASEQIKEASIVQNARTIYDLLIQRVKRKHYFPRDLNARFLSRIGGEA